MDDGSSAALLALLRRTEEDVADGRTGRAGRGVLRLAGLTAEAVALLSRLAETVVVVLSVHPLLGTSVASGHRLASLLECLLADTRIVTFIT